MHFLGDRNINLCEPLFFHTYISRGVRNHEAALFVFFFFKERIDLRL